jgi:hypothetical protein
VRWKCGHDSRTHIALIKHEPRLIFYQLFHHYKESSNSSGPHLSFHRQHFLSSATAPTTIINPNPPPWQTFSMKVAQLYHDAALSEGFAIRPKKPTAHYAATAKLQNEFQQTFREKYEGDQKTTANHTAKSNSAGNDAEDGFIVIEKPDVLPDKARKPNIFEVQAKRAAELFKEIEEESDWKLLECPDFSVEWFDIATRGVRNQLASKDKEYLYSAAMKERERLIEELAAAKAELEYIKDMMVQEQRK